MNNFPKQKNNHQQRAKNKKSKLHFEYVRVRYKERIQIRLEIRSIFSLQIPERFTIWKRSVLNVQSVWNIPQCTMFAQDAQPWFLIASNICVDYWSYYPNSTWIDELDAITRLNENIGNLIFRQHIHDLRINRF